MIKNSDFLSLVWQDTLFWTENALKYIYFEKIKFSSVWTISLDIYPKEQSKIKCPETGPTTSKKIEKTNFRIKY